jgi:hypothetical protein
MSDPFCAVDRLKIESILEGRTDGDVAAYSINGRSLTKLAIPDLLMWWDRYRAEYLREVRAERRDNGQGTSSTVLARF